MYIHVKIVYMIYVYICVCACVYVYIYIFIYIICETRVLAPREEALSRIIDRTDRRSPNH